MTDHGVVAWETHYAATQCVIPNVEPRSTGFVLSCSQRSVICQATIQIVDAFMDVVLASRVVDGDPSLSELRKIGKAFAIEFLDNLAAKAKEIPDQ